ncbi:MAG TPA: hypothetical protein GX525_04805 [Bacilli bacterium]|nr:hypothetical protein [Bacilli bacterium]
MIKKRQALFFIFLASLLIFSGCSSETSIVGKTNDSKIILDEGRNFVTFHAVLHNNGEKPATPYYAKFELKNDVLKSKIGSDTIVLMEGNGEEPIAIPIGGKMDFFVSETFEYEGTLTETDLKDAVDIVIFSDSDEEITRFTMTNVEKESVAK